MRFEWSKVVQYLFAPPAGGTGRPLRDITKFEIGVCPGCRQLRATGSLRCGYCDSAAPVAADA